MIKVICIDDKNPETVGVPIHVKEGEIYEVYECSLDDCYFVTGLEYSPADGSHDVYLKRRFIPLSSIDETEIQKQREEVYAL